MPPYGFGRWSNVPEYAISPIELKPNNDIHQGDLVEVAAMISNNGLADGEANLVLELVESTGARGAFGCTRHRGSIR